MFWCTMLIMEHFQRKNRYQHYMTKITAKVAWNVIINYLEIDDVEKSREINL